MSVTAEQLADEMFELVREYQGKKKFKAGDLTKEMMKKHGDAVDKKLCKLGIRTLMDSGRCVYTYFGGSFIEMPRVEGAAEVTHRGPPPAGRAARASRWRARRAPA